MKKTMNFSYTQKELHDPDLFVNIVNRAQAKQQQEEPEAVRPRFGVDTAVYLLCTAAYVLCLFVIVFCII